MYPLIQTFLFILNKWNMSLYEFNFIGKILFYLPILINNILTFLWYVILSPFIYLGFVVINKTRDFETVMKLYLLKNKLDNI